MASNHNVLSVGELQEWLNKKADIEEVKLTDFSDAFAKMLNYNALNCLLNNGAITDSTQLKFRLYHLRNTDQNAPYYNIPDSDSYIYVVFEQETGYMVSNCAKLQWELTIARGVSDFDIEHRTIRFLEYQASISHLNLKESSSSKFWYFFTSAINLSADFCSCSYSSTFFCRESISASRASCSLVYWASRI